MKRNLVLVFVLVSFCFYSKAQGNFDLHVGGSFPTGDFESNDSETGGGASTGLNIGLKYLYPVSNCDGLSFTGGIDWHYNGIKQTIKDDFKAMATASGFTNPSVDYFSYLNVPVLVGLNYQTPVNKTFAIFGDAGLGINYSKVTDLTMRFTIQGTNASATETFDPVIKMAFQVGAGLLILKQYTIGLHYNILGSYAYNGKMTAKVSGYSQTTDITPTGNVNVNILDLAVGIRF